MCVLLLCVYVSHTYTHARTHARTHTRTYAHTHARVHTRQGVPEADTKKLIAYAKANNKILIGPATVGGLQARARACVCMCVLCACGVCAHRVH